MRFKVSWKDSRVIVNDVVFGIVLPTVKKSFTGIFSFYSGFSRSLFKNHYINFPLIPGVYNIFLPEKVHRECPP